MVIMVLVSYGQMTSWRQFRLPMFGMRRVNHGLVSLTNIPPSTQFVSLQ